MYAGALDPKIPAVRKLLSIRKEISIISGFTILTHSLVRVVNNLPGAIKFFTNKAEYLENMPVVSELGAGISSFSFILGIALLIIFVPLWVTSFDAVHRRMGGVKWKKLQKWAYVLYALMFVHALMIQTGGMLNPRGGAPRAAVETAAPAANAQSNDAANARPAEGTRPERQVEQQTGQRPTAGQTRGPAGRAPSKGISDINVSQQTKQYLHIISLLLIYGSYLYLRLRKSKKDVQRKAKF